jgi:SpoVK/Ycf46/Vps4 family AAA+-type ATPase
LRNELAPRFSASGVEALSGAAVCGPIGGGKTYIFEALASELDMVVLVLKNIRSQWFGQTDVIFERLRRVLNALAKVLIFVDEADTQFGGVGADTHETERRLTGKLQAMMSDTAMRGRVIWLLVTARIHLLSPDLRRPGRVGDLIIPTLDPEGPDREEFLQWAVKPVLPAELTAEQLKRLEEATRGYSAASFASLRSELKAKAKREGAAMDFERILTLVADNIPPAIEETRRYQTLQALINCTRRSLLPDPNVTEEQRQKWAAELRALEARGVR